LGTARIATSLIAYTLELTKCPPDYITRSAVRTTFGELQGEFYLKYMHGIGV